MVHYTVTLTNTTITSAANGSTLCRTDSYDSQHSFEQTLAVLPLDTVLRVEGCVHLVKHPRVSASEFRHDTERG